MENVQSSARILKNLVKEEASVQKNLHSAKSETEPVEASAEEEGNLKKEAREGVKK